MSTEDADRITDLEQQLVTLSTRLDAVGATAELAASAIDAAERHLSTISQIALDLPNDTSEGAEASAVPVGSVPPTPRTAQTGTARRQTTPS